jgi:hypothetical protein
VWGGRQTLRILGHVRECEVFKHAHAVGARTEVDVLVVGGVGRVVLRERAARGIDAQAHVGADGAPGPLADELREVRNLELGGRELAGLVGELVAHELALDGVRVRRAEGAEVPVDAGAGGVDGRGEVTFAEGED